MSIGILEANSMIGQLNRSQRTFDKISRTLGLNSSTLTVSHLDKYFQQQELFNSVANPFNSNNSISPNITCRDTLNYENTKFELLSTMNQKARQYSHYDMRIPITAQKIQTLLNDPSFNSIHSNKVIEVSPKNLFQTGVLEDDIDIENKRIVRPENESKNELSVTIQTNEKEEEESPKQLLRFFNTFVFIIRLLEAPKAIYDCLNWYYEVLLKIFSQ